MDVERCQEKSGGQKKTESQKDPKAIEDKSVNVTWKPTHKYLQWAELSFNPIVTGISLFIILIFCIWSISNPDIAQDEFGGWKKWIGESFTWLYIGSVKVWLVFVAVIYFSSYSDVKIGSDDSKPEYNNATWFCMLFACGVGTGVFFYGVAEPIYHYIGPNRFTADHALPDNQLAQDAILLTFYHWGLHAWGIYTIVGLLLGLMAHRKGLPLTMKSCFYPLIGDKIFGWLGDVVDILSVIATLFGVCTSLGLGTMQINEGLHNMNTDIPRNKATQLIIIWSITSVATCSVLSGVGYGIRRISEICFCIGLSLMFSVLVLDNTVFLLNLYVQSLGHYLQNMVQTGSHTDAFAQLGPSSGSHDRERFVHEDYDHADGPSTWMDAWTIFYWGWWVSWSPFVGMFIAKISRGRTVKNFIAGTMVAPVVYVFLWMTIFGGAGIRMEREAAGADLCCHNVNMTRVLELSTNTTAAGAFVTTRDGLCDGDSLDSFDLTPMDDVEDDVKAEAQNHTECNRCSLQLLGARAGLTYTQLQAEVALFTKPDWWGTTTPTRSFTRLSCRKVTEMWFDVMMSYRDIGRFLSGFSILSLVLYFVTSSDSGSLVIDCLASNGHPEPPRLQRLLWALLEGTTASALLVAGGEKALSALQAMSIATGFIYTILICIACIALWRALKDEAGALVAPEHSFEVGILDPFFTDPFTEIRKSWRDRSELLLHFLLNIALAPLTVARAVARVRPGGFWSALVPLAAFLAMFVLLHVVQIAADGVFVFAWVFFIVFCGTVSVFRGEVRDHLQISGHPIEDFIFSLFLYPSVAVQLDFATRGFSPNSSGQAAGKDNNGLSVDI